MWLWRQRCVWGSVCDGVWSRCGRGWGQAKPSTLLFFQASVPLSFAAKAQGCFPAWPPSCAASPILPLGYLCFTFSLFSLLPRLGPLSCASTQGPTHTLPSGQAGPLAANALRLMLSQPQALATPESRLAAAWGLGQIPKQGVTVVQEQALGVGCESRGIPANSGKANAYDTLPAVLSPSGTHTLHSP